MTRYVLAPQAQESLKNVRDYTLDQFGRAQASRYIEKLRDRMQRLAEDPLQGKARDELKLGYYSYFEGAHTLYYRLGPNGIEVMDVLHQSMEPSKHL